MKAVLHTVLLVLLANQVKPDCPAVDDLPVYYEGSDNFFCARFYYGIGHDLATNACKGCSVYSYADVPHGANQDAGSGGLWPIGSLIVRPGCTFYQFHETGYNGAWNVFEGPGIYTKIDNGQPSPDQGCAKGRPAYMCRCQMRQFNCVPEDGYNVVIVCDATNALSDSECIYKKTIGTKQAEAYNFSMSIDYTIKAGPS